MGRKRLESRNVTISLTLDPNMVSKIDKFADEIKSTRSELIREILEERFMGWGEK